MCFQARRRRAFSSENDAFSEARGAPRRVKSRGKWASPGGGPLTGPPPGGAYQTPAGVLSELSDVELSYEDARNCEYAVYSCVCSCLHVRVRVYVIF